jgi:uncharacterized membrane protein
MKVNGKIKKIKEKGEELNNKVKERVIGYLTAAFGLVAGLAWNDAVRGLIDHLFPLSKNSIWAKFAYASVLTVVVVFVTLSLIKISEKKKEVE